MQRRDFLRLGAAGFATTAAGGFFTCPILQANQNATPNEKIGIGVIGIGGQGRGNMGAHLKSVVAVCEVDRTRLGQAKEKAEAASGKPVAAYGDYRKLLEDKNVNAVVISTPDHWHALPAIDACLAGKDVYVEKPLTLAIREGRVLTQAARKHKRIVQTGSQQRSDARFRLACELVRNGKIGKVHTVRVGLPGPNFSGPPVADADPPADLDYDFWLGPAPKRPYNAKRVHYLFRFFWDYSGGQMTNWGAHHLDIAQWGLGMDESGPIETEGTAKFHPQMWFETPTSFQVTHKYANGVTLLCGPGQPDGTTFEGDKGKIFVNRGKISVDPEGILKETLTDKDVRLYVSTSHHGNWLQCIRDRKLPICDAEVGHRSATVCHLGNIALRTGKKLKWDPAKEEMIGDAEANKWVDKEYRAPWKLPVIG